MCSVSVWEVIGKFLRVDGWLHFRDDEVMELNAFELPLFSVDKEAELGSTELAAKPFAKFGECDALMIFFAEHNGSYTAAYKNLFDWCSGIDEKVFRKKPMAMIATSPGGRGASMVLATAFESASRFGGDVKASL